MLSTLVAARKSVGLGVGVTDSDDLLTSMLGGITPVFEGIINRAIFVEERTSYLDVNPAQTNFPLRNYPIRSVTSINFDSTGFFASTSDLVLDSDYVFDNESIRLGFVPSREGNYRRALRVTYAGGLVYSANEGACTVSGVTGTPSGDFTTTTASGTVVSLLTGALTYLVTAGSLRAGQVVTGTGWSATIVAITRQCVRNDYPGLEEAALMQLKFRWQRKDSLGRNSTVMGNGSTTFDVDYRVHAAVQEYLLHLRRTPTDG